MKILHVDTVGLIRGGQMQIALLARGLRERGHDALIATPADGPFFHTAGESGLAVTAIPRFSPTAVFALIRAVRTVKPAIIHVHDARGMVPAAIAAGMCGGTPVVASRRVAFPSRMPLARKLKYTYGARIVIATSENIRDLLESEGIRRDRLTVIRDGVDVARFSADPVWPGTGPNGRVSVGTLGALSPEKGLDVFIRAAALLTPGPPHARFVIAGDGIERERLRNLVDAFGIGAEVEFLGHVDDVPTYLRGLTVFVQPSRYEGLGSAILEAMAAGLPVVASSVGGIPETIEDGSTGFLLNPGDPERLSRAILRLLRAPHEARAMGEAGRKRAEAFFSARRMVDDTLSLYEGVLGARR